MVEGWLVRVECNCILSAVCCEAFGAATHGLHNNFQDVIIVEVREKRVRDHRFQQEVTFFILKELFW